MRPKLCFSLPLCLYFFSVISSKKLKSYLVADYFPLRDLDVCGIPMSSEDVTAKLKSLGGKFPSFLCRSESVIWVYKECVRVWDSRRAALELPNVAIITPYIVVDVNLDWNMFIVFNMISICHCIGLEDVFYSSIKVTEQGSLFHAQRQTGRRPFNTVILEIHRFSICLLPSTLQ